MKHTIAYAPMMGLFVALIQLGGLTPVQTSTTVVALPLIPVLVILCASLLRRLKEDFGTEASLHHLVTRTPAE